VLLAFIYESTFSFLSLYLSFILINLWFIIPFRFKNLFNYFFFINILFTILSFDILLRLWRLF